MKNILSLLLLYICSLTFSQVTIGTANATNSSVLLEFSTESKGIILPWVTNTTGMTTPLTPGTIIFDASDRKVKFRRGGNTPEWVDLTVATNGVVDTTLQNGLTENAGAGVILGAETSTAPGALVLESTTQAMVLPKVHSPFNAIINPAPGMIVYDTQNKQLAVFNGTSWSFWKPSL